MSHKHKSFKKKLWKLLEKLPLSSASSDSSEEEEYSSPRSGKEPQRNSSRKRKRQIKSPTARLSQKRRRIFVQSSDTSDEDISETPVNLRKNKEELDSILGVHPSQDNIEFGPPLDPDIISRWSSYISSGFDKDTRDTWAKIKFPENGQFLDAPKVNPEIETILNSIDLKKDALLANMQNKLGKSLTFIGQTLEGSLKNDTLTQSAEATHNLVEAAKILCELHFLLSTHRKHQMYPIIGDVVARKVANEAKTDTWLFGTDFSEKSKAAHDLQKSAASLGLKKKFNNMVKPNTSKQNLNFQRQYSKPRLKSRNGRVGQDRRMTGTQPYRWDKRREYRRDKKY